MRRLILAIAIASTAPTLANADCDGPCNLSHLIGETYTGLLFNQAFARLKADINLDDCQIEAFETPPVSPDDVGNFHACQDFDLIRVKTNWELSSKQPDNRHAELTSVPVHYMLLGLERSENSFATSMVSGKVVWVRDTAPVLATPARYIPTGYERLDFRLFGQTTSAHLYAEPQLSSIAPASSYHGTAQFEFLSKVLYKESFSPNEVDSYVKLYTDRRRSTRKGEDQLFIGFTYRTEAIVTAEDNSQWYLVEEYLTVDTIGLTEQSQKRLAGMIDSEQLNSAPIRTLYLPFRDKDGIVQSIFVPGPYYD